MRTSGRPSGSAVATAMPLGSLISEALAASNHSANRPMGSAASGRGGSAAARAAWSCSLGEAGIAGEEVMALYTPARPLTQPDGDPPPPPWAPWIQSAYFPPQVSLAAKR